VRARASTGSSSDAFSRSTEGASNSSRSELSSRRSPITGRTAAPHTPPRYTLNTPRAALLSACSVPLPSPCNSHVEHHAWHEREKRGEGGQRTGAALSAGGGEQAHTWRAFQRLEDSGRQRWHRLKRREGHALRLHPRYPRCKQKQQQRCPPLRLAPHAVRLTRGVRQNRRRGGRRWSGVLAGSRPCKQSCKSAEQLFKHSMVAKSYAPLSSARDCSAC
jgi:hypothetical protein